MNQAVRNAALKLAQTAQNMGLSGSFRAVPAAQLQALQAQLDLPEFLVDWYAAASPQDFEIPTIGNWIPLEGADTLEQAQLGYRYNAISKAELPGWDQTWLVIAGEPEFPVIARTASANETTIYHGRLRDGAWQLITLSTDLEGFLLGVDDYLQLYIGQFSRNVLDNDDMLLATFRDAFTAALDQRPATAGRAQAWLRDWLGTDM